VTDDEHVVLCTEDGAAAGTTAKHAVHHSDTPLHLAFSCYVFDTAARLLVTWRAADKRTWPGVRTNSCCGHPLPGEPMPEAVVRRLYDELGLRVQPDDVALMLPRFRYRAVMADTGTVENELCPVWRVVVPVDTSVHHAPAEVDRYAWTPWREFADDAQRDPSLVSPWCALQVDELAGLGDDPLSWPVSDVEALPLAAAVG
jgi:isopentenyl-diphosphate Delta-isomerase